jgi:hypothetical protein
MTPELIDYDCIHEIPDYTAALQDIQASVYNHNQQKFYKIFRGIRYRM